MVFCWPFPSMHRKLFWPSTTNAPSLPTSATPAPPTITSKDHAAHQLPHSSSSLGAATTHAGRPSWVSCLRAFLAASQPGAAGDATAPGKDVAAAVPQQLQGTAASYVYVCGPAGMTAAVHRELAGLVSTGKFSVSLHDINYSL
jgi:hypothetical protein